MSEYELECFLKALSSTCGGDVFDCYLQLYGKLAGFFKMKGVSDPDEGASATIALAGRKIAAGAPVPDVGKYCRGIARNLAREILRREHRERTAFLNFIEERHDGPDEEVMRIDQILKPCFELLDEKDQELLADYCQVLRGHARADHRREMAVRRNTTVLALRMHVTRLRKDLTDCVRKRPRHN